MKISNYNIIVNYKSKELIFNSLTCALAEVSCEFLNIMSAIKNNTFDVIKTSDRYASIVEDMLRGGFIVEDYFNELDFLRFKNFQGKFQTNEYSLAIAPTFFCNFACPYCYENTKEEFMSHDVMNAVSKEVEIAAKNHKTIHISWYGGEPLLAKRTIWELSNKFISDAEKYGVNYSAQIITNGYLIDDETVRCFVKYKINRVQVTIDGPSDIHNNRRKLKNSIGATYDTIIKNAKKVLDAGIGLAIRINIDKTNENRVNELLDSLSDYGLTDAYVYLGHLRVATEFCESIRSGCLSDEEYAMRFVDFERLVLQKGFNPNYYPNYPRAKSNNCTADSIMSKVVAPDGSLYKCWHDISDPHMSIGNIKDARNVSQQNIMTQVKYMLSNPFVVDKCKNCNVLPLCMGGCPTVIDEVSCQNCKYSITETIKIEYDLLTRDVGKIDYMNPPTEDERDSDRNNSFFLVDPLYQPVTALNVEMNCFDFNYSCGTPKRWWFIQ